MLGLFTGTNKCNFFCKILPFLAGFGCTGVGKKVIWKILAHKDIIYRQIRTTDSFLFFLKVQNHLHQTQAQQVKQYLTLGSKLASQAHPVTHPHPGQALGTVPIMRNGHMLPVSDSSTPGSPITLLTLANNHENEVSTSCDLIYLSVCFLINNFKHSALITLTMKGWVSCSDKRCFFITVIFLRWWIICYWISGPVLFTLLLCIDTMTDDSEMKLKTSKQTSQRTKSVL